MTLALDPRLPLLWRTPHSLQLGLDDPPVVLNGVTTAQERMLAALAIGVSRSGLTLIGRQSGLSAERVAEFEGEISPALSASMNMPRARVYIDGSGHTVDRLELRLREAGLEPCKMVPNETDPKTLRSGESGRPRIGRSPVADFAVIVGDFVLEPERRGRWLRRDIPHLPLVFGDTSVTIGPFIEPGAGPCLYCLELHHTDADPAWPALASQLLGRVSSAQTLFAASEAATLATRMVLSRVRSEAGTNSAAGAALMSITVNTDSGQCHETFWQTHPECACAGLKTVATAQDLRETVKENSLRSVVRATQTTTGEAACVPA